MKKVLRLIIWITMVSVAVVGNYFCIEKKLVFWEGVFSMMFPIALGKTVWAIQDLCDTTNWKTSLRKHRRGKLIRNNDLIRISFSYLYRIKIKDKYFLVKNCRNTGKYQPVGGVYKMEGNEKLAIKNLFHVVDDDKIPIDNTSRDDYRLQMESKYLRRFVKRFNCRKAERERIDNVGRELREELIDSGIVKWKRIKYRFCGRHMTELKFGEHFQIYELLLADIVELLPTPEQENDLIKLMEIESDHYCFATADQITRLGVDTEKNQLYERIGDHTKKIIQENEGQLLKIANTGNVYTIDLLE